MVALLFTFLVPVMVAVYTFNYARWAAKRRLYRPAVGLYILAAACIAVPAFVYWYAS